MTAAIITTFWAAFWMGSAPAVKLAPPLAKEMADAVVAVDKTLGLESWESHGAKVCVDRGGEGAGTKNVSAYDTLRCASAAVEKGFPGLGKSYVLAILMASIGPVTVVALGTGEAAGWGAYSCDPGRKCLPTKIAAPSKWGKRLADRKAKACAQTTTIWLPGSQLVCEGVSANSGTAAPPASATPPAQAAPPAPAPPAPAPPAK